MLFFFFFQAEDGIRDADVTGVQTCALPIYHAGIRTLGRHQRDLGCADVLFANGANGVQARSAASDDEMTGRHQTVSRASTRAVRSAAKSPIQSLFCPSTNVMASVGHASAQAGCPSHRLHL